MERVDPAVLQATILMVRRHLALAKMAERSFLGNKIEYRDHVDVVDWCTILTANIALRLALAGGYAYCDPLTAGNG